MKKLFLIGGFASAIVACNTNSANNSHQHDRPAGAAHQKTNTNAKNTRPISPITDAMDKMMRQMHGAKSTGNNDIDFAAMMLEHHKGAVEMSKVEVDKGGNAELKTFAQQVIDDQNKEIEFMEDFLAKTPATVSLNSADFQNAMHHSMMAMMDGSTVAYNDIDRDFAAQMIPHHQSAVDMAEAYLNYGKEPRLTTLCKAIISSQTKEISWLKEWLTKNK